MAVSEDGRFVDLLIKCHKESQRSKDVSKSWFFARIARIAQSFISSTKPQKSVEPASLQPFIEKQRTYIFLQYHTIQYNTI